MIFCCVAKIAVKVVKNGERSKLMHCKYFIIDDKAVGIGSLNWTNQAMSVNDEVITLIDDSE